MLWSACLRDDRLSCTSWAGLARGAIHIISKYRNLYTTASYNFVWTHLRRIITSAHLVMLCYWRCELEKGEAEQALCIALYLLELSSTRWPSAVPAKGKIETVAKSLCKPAAASSRDCEKLNRVNYSLATFTRAGPRYRVPRTCRLFHSWP